MLTLAHADGYVLLIGALLFVLVGHSHNRFVYRAFYLLVAFIQFILALEHLGLERVLPQYFLYQWYWLRVWADCSVATIAGIMFYRRWWVTLHPHKVSPLDADVTAKVQAQAVKTR